jgi:hypothetical protein
MGFVFEQHTQKNSTQLINFLIMSFLTIVMLVAITQINYKFDSLIAIFYGNPIAFEPIGRHNSQVLKV